MLGVRISGSLEATDQGISGIRSVHIAKGHEGPALVGRANGVDTGRAGFQGYQRLTCHMRKNAGGVRGGMRPLGNLLFATAGKFLDHFVAHVKTNPATTMSVRQTGHTLEPHDVGGQLLVSDNTDRMGTDTKGHRFLVRTSQFAPGRADPGTGFAPTLSGFGPLDVGQFHSGAILLHKPGLKPTTMVVTVAVAPIPDR